MAGILLYANINNEPHLLMGLERKENAYSEFAGHMKMKSDKDSETFAETAIRECYEESSGLYNISYEELRKGKIYFEMNNKNHEAVIVLVPARVIYYTDDLIKVQRKIKLKDFLEKSYFMWIPVRSFLKNFNLQKSEINVNGIPVKVRWNIKNMLQQHSFIRILREILAD